MTVCCTKLDRACPFLVPTRTKIFATASTDVNRDISARSTNILRLHQERHYGRLLLPPCGCPSINPCSLWSLEIAADRACVVDIDGTGMLWPNPTAYYAFSGKDGHSAPETHRLAISPSLDEYKICIHIEVGVLSLEEATPLRAMTTVIRVLSQHCTSLQSCSYILMFHS
ncbi:hypothetical protein EJ03DRAFT_211084 [Teratosphaeria nubilosa]|uniref:Uncharacterized protein n=1 Tax=Teratosphaeria nubilosa TaxID=161662 RepID=A0A6G1KX92_9PEZI|nr:hypothetical protein EJ03DRAFT_211084 [Teratosphaeria nubilosa]